MMIPKKPEMKLTVAAKVVSNMQRKTALNQDCCACTEHILPSCSSSPDRTKQNTTPSFTG